MNQEQFHGLVVGNEIRVKNLSHETAYNYWTVTSIRNEAIFGGLSLPGRDITFVANWDNTIEKYVNWGDTVSVDRMELVE